MPTSALPIRHTRRVARLARGVRPVRVVHALDGIEQEVPPDALLEAGTALWELWRQDPAFRAHDLVVGIDAGGMLAALALSLASRTPYRMCWRLDLDLDDKLVFEETHSAQPEIYVYGPFSGRRVLIADDEVTTGRTASNLARALAGKGADVVGVACLVEDLSGHGRVFLHNLGLPLVTLTTL